MSGILKFFLNAIKAILLSPFYIVYFCLYLIVSFFIHVVGEVKVLFSGFNYGSKEENKYTKQVKNLMNKGGER